ncbi:Golgi-associated plant pathogenesis-related protein 1 [Drosophila kikkawai]|uniref:Golgi-associated plant pathogenesis-related protein 1 n=1 Tax=Drosophila kikkawai TaxID=30033 RepID=A0A6P4J5J8_DROKI|nr:Golgi-associated plant pathogenesis-related protein 1 [Drosophila kikkawai]
MNSLGIWIFVLLAAGQLDCILAETSNANAVLNYTNSKRKLHGCRPLIWNDKLSENCKQHAEDIAKSGKVTHSKPIDSSYTENICTFGIKEDALRLCVEKWYDGARYDIMDAEAQEFTAMIWRSSEYMGYGEAMLGSGTAVMVVRFAPGGNVLGQYTYNVPPIQKKRDKSLRSNQAYRASLSMFTIMTIIYWTVTF